MHQLSGICYAFCIVSYPYNRCNFFYILGALGVMYLQGLGVEKNLDKAFICLKDAASRGNVYAMGHLTAYYYQCKLYTKAVELGARCVFTFSKLNYLEN